MRLWSLLPAICLTHYGCATTLDSDAALTTVPFSIELGGKLVVDVRLNGSGPFRFVVDTAATGSFLLPQTQDSLGLEPLPGIRATVYGAVATGQYPIVELESLALGDEIWDKARLIALPAATEATANIDGVLGADFLMRYALGLDVRGRALHLYHPATIGDRNYSGWSVVPLRAERIGNVSVPLHFLDLEIAGNVVPALFDLGAGVSVLNAAAAQALRLTPTRRDQEGQFAGALGSEPLVARLSEQAIQTANVRWRNESFLIADPEIFTTLGRHDLPLGILGAGLFLQRDLIIDFAHDRLLVLWQMAETDTVMDVPEP